MVILLKSMIRIRVEKNGETLMELSFGRECREATEFLRRKATEVGEI